MKLPFKYIAILVIVSLAGIFAYQAYWLTGLYHTMHDQMERDITEAMRMSDYNEMMIRVEKLRNDSIKEGTVSVSAGYDNDKSYVSSSTSITTTIPKQEPEKADSLIVEVTGDTISEYEPADLQQSAMRVHEGIVVLHGLGAGRVPLAALHGKGVGVGEDVAAAASRIQ